MIELTKLKLRSALVRLRRTGLLRVAEKLPTELLDDLRVAATEELARRGLHVITQQPRGRLPKEKRPLFAACSAC
jgi:hypothetical protein